MPTPVSSNLISTRPREADAAVDDGEHHGLPRKPQAVGTRAERSRIDAELLEVPQIADGDRVSFDLPRDPLAGGRRELLDGRQRDLPFLRAGDNGARERVFARASSAALDASRELLADGDRLARYALSATPLTLM